MSLNRYGAKVDANHRMIVNALRAMGCCVERIRGSTEGCPDILVGCFGIDQTAEIKPPLGVRARRELRESQVVWHSRWGGRKPVVLRTIEDCVALVATLRGAMTANEVGGA